MRSKSLNLPKRIAIARKFLKGSSVRELAKEYSLAEQTIAGYLRNHIDKNGRVISAPPAMSKELQLPGEKWKVVPVPSKNKIEASNLGRIKSHAYGRERILDGNIKFGYRSICYRVKNNKRRDELSHMLVAKAWLEPRPSTRHVIVHLDHNRWDNSPANLKWMIKRDAQRHARHSPYMEILRKRARAMPTEQANKARYGKLSRKEVISIKQKIHNGRRIIDIAKEYGIAEMTVSRIHRGIIWADVLPQLTRKKKELKIVPVETRIKIINALRAGMQGKVAAALYGFDPTTISRIKKSLQHGND